MDDTQVLLRQIFQTENRLTMPLSASGSGGIEASVVNTLEEGDEAIICVNGIFSSALAGDCGAHCVDSDKTVEAPYGKQWTRKMCGARAKARKSRSLDCAGRDSSGALTQTVDFRKVPTSWRVAGR